MQKQLEILKSKYENLLLGGGVDKIDKHKAKGKMTAWERVLYLLDEGTSYVEVGAFAGDGMYAEHGGCPNGGVVVVLGYVRKRLCVIVSNDATVKAGAWFPLQGKELARAGNCHGKSPPHHLFGGFRRGILTHAGGDFPR